MWFKACTGRCRSRAGALPGPGPPGAGPRLTPLALDVERGFLLLPDGGPTLRESEGARTDLAAWERMFQEYAAMQRGLEPCVDELRRDRADRSRGPTSCPRCGTALLADDRLLLLGDEDGLTEAQRDELVAEQPAYAARCAELAAYGIPLSLQHDDLHDNNVFGPAEPGGPLRVFDWGDAVVGHPFGVLLISLRVVSDLLEVAESAPEVRRLRDAYLEPWTGEWVARRPARRGPAGGAGRWGVARGLLPAGHAGVAG